MAIDFSNSNNFTGYPEIPDSLHGSKSLYLECMRSLQSAIQQLPINGFYGIRFGDSETVDKKIGPLLPGDTEQQETFNEIIQKYTEA